MTTRPMGWSFEDLHDSINSIQEPSAIESRETLWVIDRHLGVGRGQQGALELFVVGPRLLSRKNAVRRHMEFGIWATSTGQELEANRIVLPHGPHFVSLAVLITFELLRAGIGGSTSNQDALYEVEPLIELALLRGALAEESVVGLMGELLLLERILEPIALDFDLVAEAIDMWRGHLRGERDFRIGDVGIEVKTTQLLSSTHSINSLSQIELRDGERDLYLLSIGLNVSESGGQTLPSVVARLLAILAEDTATEKLSTTQNRLLRHIAAYGVGSAVGYDHITMKSWAAYQTAYRFTFEPRLYSLLDSEVRLIRQVDLTDSMVVPSSVTYTVDLPDRVNARNPSEHWATKVENLTAEYFA